MKTLVVYYSRTGTTKSVAERIAQELGAEIEEIIDKKNRRGLIGFLTSGYDATRGKKTKIAETKQNPNEFDLIVIGTPVWNSRPTPAIRTYLSNYDLSGKRAAIFCTNEGRGGENAITKIKALLANSNFTEQLVVSKPAKSNSEAGNKILEWCNKLRLP